MSMRKETVTMDVHALNDAFRDFTAASKSLESYYGALQQKIDYLTTELEQRNRQLKEALADAKSAKDHLNAVLASLVEAIIVTDTDGTVTMMNRAAERLFGSTEADARGRPIASLGATFRADDTDVVMEADGRRFTVILSHADIRGGDGTLRGRVTLVQDITRLRELEVRHERNQRLVAMGEMAAKLVHEIRNPLCSMELYASMLHRELERPDQQEMAQGISTGIADLNAIMTNMLHFARPKRPALRQVRLDHVVADALRSIEPLLEPRKIRIERTLAACEAPADAELLKQVLLNILMNAVQAMPDGGDLRVALQRDPEGGALVEVADTGVGIPREHLEKIFDPFFTTKDHGTGLGLVIASTLMQANNGYVKVASEPGRGSTFTLCFPGPAGGAGLPSRKDLCAVA